MRLAFALLMFVVHAGALRAHPDVVVVLGCQNRVELDARARAAARLVRRAGARHPPVVIFSGGARYAGDTEAGALEARVVPLLHGRPLAHRLVRETDSLDTVGNALFTALTLRARGLLGLRTLVVVTSDFHAARARSYFACVLSTAVRVEVLGVAPAPRPPDEIARRAAREAASAAQGSRLLEDPDLDRTLARLVREHRYYRGRTDLLARHARPSPRSLAPVN